MTFLKWTTPLISHELLRIRCEKSPLCICVSPLGFFFSTNFYHVPHSKKVFFRPKALFCVEFASGLHGFPPTVQRHADWVKYNNGGRVERWGDVFASCAQAKSLSIMSVWSEMWWEETKTKRKAIRGGRWRCLNPCWFWKEECHAPNVTHRLVSQTAILASVNCP